jgi:hypothetical protein
VAEWLKSLTCDCHFQQYFSYIVAVSFIGGENHPPVASHWQTYHIMVTTSLTPLMWAFALIPTSSRDCKVVGFITTYAVSAYHHYSCEFETRSSSQRLQSLSHWGPWLIGFRSFLPKSIRPHLKLNTFELKYTSVYHFKMILIDFNFKNSVTCNRWVVFSTNKTDHHDITEILLKVALNTIS